MILIGDTNIPYEKITKIDSIKDILSTQPNSTVLFSFNFEILKYTQLHNINSAVIVDSIKDIVYANSLESRYIIVDENIAKQAQKIADNYMFDSKILVNISDENEIERMAIDEIDGVIYLNRIIDEKEK